MGQLEKERPDWVTTNRGAAANGKRVSDDAIRR